MTSPPGAWHERVAILLRRRRPSATVAAGLPHGRRFGSERGPSSSILVPVAVIGLIGDVPFSMALVPAFHPAQPLWVHARILLLALAAVAWAVAACSARAAIPHVVTDVALVIRGGFDRAIEVPRVALVSAEVIGVSRRAWMEAHGLASGDVLRASLLDGPNLVIEVDVAASGLSVRRRRRSVPPRRWMMFYANAPAALLAALRHDARRAEDPAVARARGVRSPW